jgi:hypothetical protein
MHESWKMLKKSAKKVGFNLQNEILFAIIKTWLRGSAILKPVKCPTFNRIWFVLFSKIGEYKYEKE